MALQEKNEDKDEKHIGKQIRKRSKIIDASDLSM